MVKNATLRVLVVEDHADTAQSTADLLGLWGHEVRVCGTGPDALREADAAMPDVVVLDIGLPGMDGLEVTRRMRAAARGRQPAVVAVSGYGTNDDRVRSADAGVDLHLVKPADPAELCRFLAQSRERLAPVCQCAWCGKVRTGGAWRDAEVTRGARITHGICPPCYAETIRECQEGVEKHSGGRTVAGRQSG